MNLQSGIGSQLKYSTLTIIIIITFKGAIQDFSQSPHSSANCLQHVRSSDPGAIVCKSCAAHQALITYKCHVTCHLVRRDSSAIKFDKSWNRIYLSLILLAEPLNRWRRGGNWSTRRKPLATSFRNFPTVVRHVAKCICTVPLLLCDMWPSVFALYPYCCATCGQVYLHCTSTVVQHVAKCICIVVQPRSVVNCPMVCPTTALQPPSWSGGKAISLRNGGLWDLNPGWVIPVTEQTGVLVRTLPDVFLGQL